MGLYSLGFWLLVCINPFGGSNLRECVSTTALLEVGTVELTGKNDGVEVEAYLATTGFPKGYAWCGAFVNWVFIKCNVVDLKRAGAWSPSWFPKERIIWKRGQNVARVRKGDLFGLHYAKLGRIGHVGIVVGVERNVFLTVEGNTTSELGLREGNGVFARRRAHDQVHVISEWI